MICKNCGAIIKNNEEYCRRCGSLVIIFNDKKNKDLENICVENNLKGKFKSLFNLFSRNEKSNHDTNKINKNNKLSYKNIQNIDKQFSKKINEHKKNYLK